jgi:hypothetical protein
MSDAIRLELLDADGAIREAADEAGATRATFLKRVGVTGAGFVSAGVLFDGLLSPAQAAISTKHRSKKNDGRVLLAGQELGRRRRRTRERARQGAPGRAGEGGGLEEREGRPHEGRNVYRELGPKRHG